MLTSISSRRIDLERQDLTRGYATHLVLRVGRAVLFISVYWSYNSCGESIFRLRSSRRASVSRTKTSGCQLGRERKALLSDWSARTTFTSIRTVYMDRRVAHDASDTRQNKRGMTGGTVSRQWVVITQCVRTVVVLQHRLPARVSHTGHSRMIGSPS